MGQIQRFLEVLGSTRSEALVITEGEAITLRRRGEYRPITKQPLTPGGWQSLVSECIASSTLATLTEGEDVEGVVSADGAEFVVVISRRDGVRRAEIRVGDVSGAGADVATKGRGAPESSTAGGEGTGTKAGVAPGAPAQRATALGGVAGVSSAVSAPAGPTAAASDVPHPDASADEEARGLIDTLLREQMARGGSDLHLRCGDHPILRVSGDIVRLDGYPRLTPSRLGAMLHAIMPMRNRVEYAGTNDSDFAYELPGVARFRANVLRDRRGPAAVFRSIPAEIVTAEALNISPEVQALCRLTKGLVLVTGPTGSGKSTTLCALVDLVNRTRSDHVVTIEDPIEFVHESKGCLITQRQVGMHTTSFKQALRAALREDPDVVLVGELRDLETVGIAIETAETGHLVFGTLHTSTAASTIDRVIDQFPPDRQEQIRVMLSESLRGVISQTLCRKIGGGRVAAMEILLTTPAVSNLIREGKTFQIPSVMQISRKLGMVTLHDALLDLVERRLVDPKEAYLRALDKVTLATALKARGFDTGFLEEEMPNAGGSGGGGGAAAGGGSARGGGAAATSPGGGGGRAGTGVRR